MADEENNEYINENADAESSSNDKSDAEKFYDNDSTDEKKESDESYDKSENKDEADKEESKEGESKDSKESEETDEEKTNYDDVNLPDEIPEGMDIDTQLYDSVKEIGQKYNVPKEAMQELVDKYSERINQTDQQLKDQWVDIEKGWKEQLLNDKEIGGDKFNESIDKANRAVERFGTPELKEALNHSRMGSHPELVRAFVKIGEKISSDNSVDRGSTSSYRTDAEVMFDNS